MLQKRWRIGEKKWKIIINYTCTSRTSRHSFFKLLRLSQPKLLASFFRQSEAISFNVIFIHTLQFYMILSGPSVDLCVCILVAIIIIWWTRKRFNLNEPQMRKAKPYRIKNHWRRGDDDDGDEEETFLRLSISEKLLINLHNENVQHINHVRRNFHFSIIV